MARFQTAPNLWDEATRAALDAGTLILQPGQWIRLGDMLSRFYRHNIATGHIVAFHGPSATRKLREYVAGQREAARKAAERKAVREAISAGEVPPYALPLWSDDNKRLLNGDSALPLWSGKGAPPAIGSFVTLAGRGDVLFYVERYAVEECWLMVWGVRQDDGRRGNLAGTEIRYEVTSS